MSSSFKPGRTKNGKSCRRCVSNGRLCHQHQRSLKAETRAGAFEAHGDEEASKAFHAFTHYRDLPADQRSIDAAYREHKQQCEGDRNSTKTAPRYWRQWSTEHSWVARAAAHDADLSRQRRARRARELAEAEDRAAAIARAALGRLVKRLETLDVREIPVAILDRWIKTLTDVELRALGHADKIEHRGELEVTRPDLTPLSDEDLSALRAIAIAKGRTDAN